MQTLPQQIDAVTESEVATSCPCMTRLLARIELNKRKAHAAEPGTGQDAYFYAAGELRYIERMHFGDCLRCTAESTGKFAWPLSQERVELLAQVLYTAETLSNIAVPGNAKAEEIGRLITDLRVECCLYGGAVDPFAVHPLTPAFDDCRIPETGTAAWREWQERVEAAEMERAL